MAAVLRILGIDCGSRITGYGVIEIDGRSQRAVAYGAIRVPAGPDLGKRLCVVAEGIGQVLEAWEPDEAAVEDVFTGLNVRSALVLAHVRGVAMMCAAKAGLCVASYTAAQVKGSVSGYGSAGKEQVRLMVRTLLGVREEIRPLDASDALAVAYCHANLRNSRRGRG